MGLLTTLLTLPVTGPINTAWWVAEKLHEQALAKLNDPAEIKREIAKLEARLDAGDITEEQFEEVELQLLTRLRDAKRAPQKR